MIDLTDGRIAALDRAVRSGRPQRWRPPDAVSMVTATPSERGAGAGSRSDQGTGAGRPSGAGSIPVPAGPIDLGRGVGRGGGRPVGSSQAAGDPSPSAGTGQATLEIGELGAPGGGTLTITDLEPRPHPPAGHRRRGRAAAVGLVIPDALALVLAWSVTGAATASMPGPARWPVDWRMTAAALVLWCGLIAAGRGYDVRRMSWPAPRIVVDAAARFAGISALLALVVRPEAARGLVVVVPAAVAGAVTLRWATRAIGERLLRSPTRVLVVGRADAVERAARRIAGRGKPSSRVVGRCVIADPGDGAGVPPGPLPGEVLRRRVTATARATGSDVVLLADPSAFPASDLRRLAWTLHAGGVELMIAAGPADVSADRLRVRPLAALPVLHVEAPAFTGPRRVVKSVVDRCGALVLLVVLAPVLLGIALAVRASGPGPVVFRQERVGRHGERFVMLKFRSMCADAPTLRDRLEGSNDHRGGVLFKMRRDPRVTAVGHVLRRLSLDELPQLWNVLRGEMSLVGPRPALPSEVERYEPDVLRRLLVKPGLTGLWQVSGRADLDWEESVRLDLSYVENWSLSLDAAILRRTVWAVVHGIGAR